MLSSQLLSKTYVVSRGDFEFDDKEETETETLYKVIKSDGEEKRKKISEKKKSNKCYANFGDVAHYMVFRASSPIELLDVSFFGPHKELKTKYKVYVEVLKGYCGTKRPAKSIYKKNFTVPASFHSMFTVDLKSPVYIEPGIWHAIAFELNGPDTGKLKNPKRQVIIDLDEGENEIKFDFLVESSQLPEFTFQLPGKEKPSTKEKENSIKDLLLDLFYFCLQLLA